MTNFKTTVMPLTRRQKRARELSMEIIDHFVELAAASDVFCYRQDVGIDNARLWREAQAAIEAVDQVLEDHYLALKEWPGHVLYVLASTISKLMDAHLEETESPPK